MKLHDEFSSQTLNLDSRLCGVDRLAMARWEDWKSEMGNISVYHPMQLVSVGKTLSLHPFDVFYIFGKVGVFHSVKLDIPFRKTHHRDSGLY